MTLSSKQAGFIQTLLKDRQPDEHLRTEAQAVLDGGDKRVASGIISRLLNAPRGEQRQQRTEQVRVTEPGVYRHDGVVYIVKPTRETAKLDPSERRLYAKRLVEIGGTRVTETGEYVNVEFEYAKGAIYKLSPSDLMPFEDAKRLTARYGKCIVCGRGLKDAKSVERGIGPVCRTYFDTAPVVAAPVEDEEFDEAAAECEAERRNEEALAGVGSAAAERYADEDRLDRERNPFDPQGGGSVIA